MRVDNAQYWGNISDAIGGGGGQGDVVSGLSRMLSMLGVGYRGENIIITGKDQDMMRLVGEEFNYIISQQDFIGYSNLSGTGRRPELHLTFDQILMNNYSINRNSITQSLSAFNAGTSSGSSLKINDKEYDIVIKESVELVDSISEKESYVKDLSDLNKLTVTNSNGHLFINAC